jgi:hypothetical protein
MTNIKVSQTNKVYRADKLFGIKSEANTLKTLKILLDDDTLQHYANKYSVLDFHSTEHKLICEVKGRRVSSKTYSTTMIGANKLEFARKLNLEGNTILFFFDFTDGLYYFDYKDFHTISQHKWYSKKIGGTNKRGLSEYKVHNYIPICLLKKIYTYKRGGIDYIRTPLEV